ncbi:MAG: xanthan lyase, partial [Bacteroidetes bacterium]|nr:xanthan lyase [Bacteroidota bacterium]
MSKIQTVARFEMKTLFRSWFFRIFSVLTLFILLGTNIGMLTDGGNVNLVIRSIASNIPYMNMAFLNIAQALLAIFLASDFLKRDKKLDTTEVIYTRSMTNWEYVWGKTFGVLIVFTVLNILVFLMALIINMVVSGVEVDYMAYLL